MLHPLLIATPIKFRFKFGYEVIFHCSSGCLVIRIHFVEGHDIEFMPARHTCVQVTAHAQPNIFSCVVPVKVGPKPQVASLSDIHFAATLAFHNT